MCVYNAERYLGQTLDSLLGQRFTDFELIAVNDGSTDGSSAILARRAHADPRLRVIDQPNAGIAAAANRGAATARGEFIARADSDDVHDPRRLELQVAFLDAHPDVLAVGAQMRLVDPFGLPLEVTTLPLDHDAIEAELLRGSGWSLPQPVATLRRSAFERVGGYRQQFSNSEDLDLFLRIALVGRLANLPEPLVEWRRHLASVNHSRFEVQRRQQRQIVEEAWAARGRTMPSDFDIAFENRPPNWKTLCLWGWRALKQGNTTVARAHAWASLRERPTSWEGWKLAFCALRGR
jgi:glycosyltransferase involved in cell wall biosynthesis